MKLNKFLVVLALIGILGMLSACGANNAQNGDATTAPTTEVTQVPAAQSDEPVENNTNNKEEKVVNIKIEMEDGGVIKAELYPDIAPITVANFEKLINEKFFDGLIFHRVISGFMIQGGDPLGNGTGGSEEKIKGEFMENGFMQNTLKHERGVISMARTGDPNSASSQFFIMHKDSPHLDGKYAAFGKVTEGIEVVDKIASVQTDRQDFPIEPQVIKTITIEE